MDTKIEKLLRDELSAIETYEQALEKVREYTMPEEEKQIAAICEEHRDAAGRLRESISQHGGKAPSGSGLWGSWSRLVMGGATMMGEEATIRALREGEESGASDYEEVLEKGDVPDDLRSLIQSTLLPRQRQHIQILDRLVKAA